MRRGEVRDGIIILFDEQDNIISFFVDSYFNRHRYLMYCSWGKKCVYNDFDNLNFKDIKVKNFTEYDNNSVLFLKVNGGYLKITSKSKSKLRKIKNIIKQRSNNEA